MLKSKLKPKRKLGGDQRSMKLIGICYALAVTLDTIAAAAPKSPHYFLYVIGVERKRKCSGSVENDIRRRESKKTERTNNKTE